MSHRLDYDQLLCAIWHAYLDEFCSQKSGTVKEKLIIQKSIHEVLVEVFILLEGITNLGPFTLS